MRVSIVKLVDPQDLPQREDGRPWPAQGEWTFEDYCLIPNDGQRYEVIRGRLYVSPVPPIHHQRVLGRLLGRLDDFVRAHASGEILPGPLDVVLPQDIASPVQPDVLGFRTGNEPSADAEHVQGAPDLIVEVSSPETRQLDLEIKLPAYRDARVPEAWFADTQQRTIVVYGLSEDGKSYVEISRGGDGDVVESRVLAGLRIAVSEIFLE